MSDGARGLARAVSWFKRLVPGPNYLAFLAQKALRPPHLCPLWGGGRRNGGARVGGRNSTRKAVTPREAVAPGRCGGYNHYEHRGITRCVHICTSRMSILGTQVQPRPSQGGGARAQRMRRGAPPRRAQSAAVESTQGLSLFPRAGSSGQSWHRPPNATSGHPRGPQELRGLISFSKPSVQVSSLGNVSRSSHNPSGRTRFSSKSTQARLLRCPGVLKGCSLPNVGPGAALRRLSPRAEKDCGPRPGGLARMTGMAPQACERAHLCLGQCTDPPRASGDQTPRVQVRGRAGLAQDGPKGRGEAKRDDSVGPRAAATRPSPELNP